MLFFGPESIGYVVFRTLHIFLYYLIADKMESVELLCIKQMKVQSFFFVIYACLQQVERVWRVHYDLHCYTYTIPVSYKFKMH